MIDVIITHFFPSVVLKWRKVLRIRAKDKVHKSLAEALNKLEKPENER